MEMNTVLIGILIKNRLTLYIKTLGYKPQLNKDKP